MQATRFYFDWSNYRTMLRLLRRDPPASARWKRYFGFLVGVPTIAAIHALCFALDPILFPSLRRTQVTAPTFCIGHARSGTTYLHRLMAADPQFSYPVMYELFFPSLLEKRLLRLLFLSTPPPETGCGAVSTRSRRRGSRRPTTCTKPAFSFRKRTTRF